MRPLNILHTIESSGPGGAESVLLSLVQGLDPARFRSVVVLNSPGWLEDQLHAAGIEAVRVDWRHWWDLKLPRAIARVVRERRISLIHSHLPDQNFYSCLAGRLSKRPVIATYHGPVELKNAHSLPGRLKLREVRQTAQRVVVVCDYVQTLLREVGFNDGKLCRIYNGIATERFLGIERGLLRRELGLRKNSLLVGTVGNIRGPKGHEYFIRAARLIAEKEPRAEFAISGDLDSTLAPPLVALAEKLGLKHRLRFLGFRSDVPSVLADLDVFVLPSTSEGLPLVVLEAMASALPVVATRSGGTEETVEEGRTGFLVPVADAEAIAARVIDVLENPRRAVQLGEEARRICKQNFSIRAMVSNYERVYEECLGLQPETSLLAQRIAVEDEG